MLKRPTKKKKFGNLVVAKKLYIATKGRRKAFCPCLYILQKKIHDNDSNIFLMKNEKVAFLFKVLPLLWF